MKLSLRKILQETDDLEKIDSREYAVKDKLFNPINRAIKPLFSQEPGSGLKKFEDDHLDKIQFELIKDKLEQVLSSLSPEDKQKLMRNVGIK